MASKDIERPNVVFVLTDDQGCWAMGCAGNGEIRTPHLDHLVLPEKAKRILPMTCVVLLGEAKNLISYLGLN